MTPPLDVVLSLPEAGFAAVILWCWVRVSVSLGLSMDFFYPASWCLALLPLPPVLLHECRCLWLPLSPPVLLPGAVLAAARFGAAAGFYYGAGVCTLLVNVCCLFLGLLYGVFSRMFWACIVILWTVLCPLLSLEIFFLLETSFCPVLIFPLLRIQHTQNVTLLFFLNK